MHKLSFAVAGGGSSAISSLASTPGASSVLLNGSVLYDRLSFCQYISQHLGDVFEKTSFDADSGANVDTDQTLSTSSIDSYINHESQFGFASSGAAVLLSKAALHHAFQQCTLKEMSNRTLGIGCTSTLVSHGREGRNSRAHISVVRGDGEGILWTIKLSREGRIVDENEEMGRRSRGEEEDLLAQLILSSVHHFNSSLSKDSDAFGHDSLLDRSGDELDLFNFQGTHYNENCAIFVQNSAQNVIDDGSNIDAVIVTQQRQQDSSYMFPLASTIIPPEPIIFPGSFNPPHIGHASLAQAAVKTMTKKKRQELKEYFDNKADNQSSHSMMEDMWNTTEYQSFRQITNDDSIEEGPFSVLFEMSLTNADKPAMEASEASRRVSLFGDLFNDANGDDNDSSKSSSQIPKDWGVLLTSAALFIDKARLMKKYLAPSGATFLPNKRQITFVIGTDTMTRIINPKYYGGEYENMLEAVREMGEEGVHFVVGGRLEQSKDGSVEKFVTGKEELDGLPPDVKDMFTIIQEEDFRVDISSTELRKKIAGANGS